MMQWERLEQAANNMTDPAARIKILQQAYRLKVKYKIGSCNGCQLCGRAENVSSRAFISGPTPSFVCFIDGSPGRIEVEGGLAFSAHSQARDFIKDLLRIVGFTIDQVSFISSIGCYDPEREYNGYSCKENLEWQMAATGSKVFVLMGEDAIRRVLYPVDLNDAHGTWLDWGEGINKRWYYLIRHPRECVGNRVLEEMKEDFNRLGSLLHVVWTHFVQTLMPFDKLEIKRELTYEEMCSLVAGMIKHYLLRLEPGERTDEFLKIMSRACSGGGELAVRAFWDDEFAEMIGVNVPKAQLEIQGLGKEGWSKWIP